MASDVESLALRIGSWVAYTSLILWLGEDRSRAGDGLVEAVPQRIDGVLQRRRIVREFEQVSDTIVKNLLIDTSGQESTAEADLHLAMSTLNDILSRVSLTAERVGEWKEMPGALEHIVRDMAAAHPDLRQAGGPRFDNVLRVSCVALCATLCALPDVDKLNTHSDVLATPGKIAAEVETAVTRILSLTGHHARADVTTRYCQTVIEVLDSVQLMLTDSQSFSTCFLTDIFEEPALIRRQTSGEKPISVVDAMVDSSRLIIRGEPGAGKSTLLGWLAMRAARQRLADPSADVIQPVPFFVRLRNWPNRHVDPAEGLLRTIPVPRTPPGEAMNVSQILEHGAALVLLDGLDEVPEPQRSRVWEWFRKLTDDFPSCRYVLTTRPAAIAAYQRDDRFDVLDLAPMTDADIAAVVQKWHWAAAVSRDDSTNYERTLRRLISDSSHLRQLATNPLMCSLLCALNVERRGALPHGADIYQAMVDMLLERSLIKQSEGAARFRLGYREKLSILEQLAYWYLLSHSSEVETDSVLRQVSLAVQSMPQISESPELVLRNLLDTTGILRESVPGRIDFVHRTFQEYLAARAVVSQGSMSTLVRFAHHDSWRNVVRLAAEHAPQLECERMVASLIDRARTERRYRTELFGLAETCVADRPSINHELAESVIGLGRQGSHHGGEPSLPFLLGARYAIVAADVVNFADPRRTMPHQLAIREGLHTVLKSALAESDIDWNACHVEDRGDGALILAPPEVPKDRVAEVFPARLAANLRRYNAVHSAEAAIRLRVSLHAGEVTWDEHGVVSPELTVAFRMLDAQAIRDALRASSKDLAVIVSDSFYRDHALNTSVTAIGAYRRCTFSTKNFNDSAWVAVFGDDHQEWITKPARSATHRHRVWRERWAQLSNDLRSTIAARDKVTPLDIVREQAAQATPARDALAVLREPGVVIIPDLQSANDRQEPDDLRKLVRIYVAAGAKIVSVPAGHHSDEVSTDLAIVRDAVRTVPVLSRSVVVSPYQIFEARADGADMITLTTSALDQRALVALLDRVESLGMTAVVEVRTMEEVDRALEAGASVIAVSPLELEATNLDQSVFEHLAADLPAGIVRIANVGLCSTADVHAYAAAGAHAVIVRGTEREVDDLAASLMRLVMAGSHRWAGFPPQT